MTLCGQVNKAGKGENGGKESSGEEIFGEGKVRSELAYMGGFHCSSNVFLLSLF